jgi:asparagine synthase (glutamine-hydrolysing)
VSKLAKENGVKVVCAGEGADELFGGYHYLKELSNDQANAEMLELILSGRKGGLQRVDRINAANSIEPLIPFMDSKLIDLAISIPVSLKIRGGVEKWILREAFSGLLPPGITERVKEKFFQGSGSGTATSTLYDKLADNNEYEKFRTEPQSCWLRGKEEYYYFKLFRQFYPDPAVIESVHQTKNI